MQSALIVSSFINTQVGRETNQGEVVFEFDGKYYRIGKYDYQVNKMAKTIKDKSPPKRLVSAEIISKTTHRAISYFFAL